MPPKTTGPILIAKLFANVQSLPVRCFASYSALERNHTIIVKTPSTDHKRTNGKHRTDGTGTAALIGSVFFNRFQNENRTGGTVY